MWVRSAPRLCCSADGKLLAFHSTRTGSSSPDSALRAFKGASEPLGLTLDDVAYAVGTGYGRVNVPFADRTITEIACHARGANYMGGPSITDHPRHGRPGLQGHPLRRARQGLNFIMNDKCAAGTGRGMEVIADVLSVPIEDIGRRSFEIDEEPPPVSNVCTVFAKSEATSLLRAGWSVDRVLAAYCSAMAQRVAGLIERMQVEPEFFITGGIGKNIGVTRRIERLIGVESVKTPGRLGARPPDSGRAGSRAVRPLAAQEGAEGGGGGGEHRPGDEPRPAASTGPAGAGAPGIAGRPAHDRQLWLRGRLGLLLHHHRWRHMRPLLRPRLHGCMSTGCVRRSRWTTTMIWSLSCRRPPANVCEISARCAKDRTARAAPAQVALHRTPVPPAPCVTAGRSGMDLRVDGLAVSVPEGATVLEACDAAGRYVPRLCSYPGLGCGGELGVSCGLCVVLVGGGGGGRAGLCAGAACDARGQDAGDRGHGSRLLHRGAPRDDGDHRGRGTRRPSVWCAWQRFWPATRTSASAVRIGMAALREDVPSVSPPRRGVATSSAGVSSERLSPMWTPEPSCPGVRWRCRAPRSTRAASAESRVSARLRPLCGGLCVVSCCRHGPRWDGGETPAAAGAGGAGSRRSGR